MQDEILRDALRALNETLKVNGIASISISSGAASHIGYHIARELKPKRPVGRPRTLAARSEPVLQGPRERVMHWKGQLLTEFMSCASCFWQILGSDRDGNLWARVLDVQQKIIGKPIKFDKRMKPRTVTETNSLKYLVKLLHDMGDDTEELRIELGLYKDF